jgi:hypothetical protein
MASATLNDLVTKTQNLVGDPTGQTYSLSVLTPYANLAQDEMADELRNNGVGEATFVGTVITVPANTTTITQTTSPAFPANLVAPLSLYERTPGGAEQDFTLINGPQILPNFNPSTTLGFWNFIQDVTNGPTIQFIGATTAREVRIVYYGDVNNLSGGSDKVLFYGAQNAIAYKMASLCAASRGNGEGAQGFDALWQKAKDRYVSEMTKMMQARPMRRAPWLGVGRYIIGRY